MSTIEAQLYTLLRDRFQLQAFRPAQLEALLALMNQGRLLCIQPTGHGKSLLYQLPSIILPGLTIVISPLIALMRDQLTQLKARFNIPAASMNPDQSSEENERTKGLAQQGELQILFVAPEQLDHVERFNFFLGLPISLLVVDEAHCISTWGHDFRPSYRQILTFVKEMTQKTQNIKVLALTATANKKTEEDIIKQLSLPGSPLQVFRLSMDRPNIALQVFNVNGLSEKLLMLEACLKKRKGAGLIYCATRENTELVAEYLRMKGHAIIAYHAGIEANEKQRIQSAFLSDQYPLISATNALGMGIDKPNLRFIIHFDFPGSITAYYQEVGRAGRDGLPAKGILLFDPHDRKIQAHFIDSAQPSQEDFQRIQAAIKESPLGLSLLNMKRKTGLHPTKVTVIVAELVEQGFLKKQSKAGQQVYIDCDMGHKKPTLARYANQRKVRYEELDSMQAYAQQTNTCLMQILRSALGDEIQENCQRCSVCSQDKLTVDYSETERLSVGAWLSERAVPIVLHKKYQQAKSGLSILDAKLRSPEFIHFMHARTNPDILPHLTPGLEKSLQSCLAQLVKHYQFSAVISLPSRTWCARKPVGKYIAEILGAAFYPDLLIWENFPQARQGELLNNDQRKFNVENHMVIKKAPSLTEGAVLLLDDYTGSGATLNEAVRALHPLLKKTQVVIPFTIVAVKWRLGARGML